MKYCIKCGAKLQEKAEFCTKCGTPVKASDQTKKKIKDKKSIEKQIEETAESFGKTAERIGRKIEKKAVYVGDNINQWYDKSFKIAGPLIGAFIVLIILRIIIYFIQTSNEDIFIVSALGEGLYEYLLIIFASILLSGYNTYLNRKYKHQYQWIYPLISAIGFIIGIWIVAQIMLIISETNNIPMIEAIGNFIISYLYGIFILALIIAYGAQFAFGPYISHKNSKK